MTVQQLQDQIAANSKAWHSADEEEKKRLHEENVKLHGILDAQTGSSSSFDSGSGRWTSTVPGTGTYQGQSAPVVVDRSDLIRERQEAATSSTLSALERAQLDKEAALQARAAALDADYKAAKNTVAAQNEIERKNTGEWASDKGLSSGAAGQLSLSQSVAAQRELAALEEEEAQAKAQLRRDRSQMEADYAAAVAEAQAEGDQALAEALMKEAERFDEAQRQSWKDQEEQRQDIFQMAQDTQRYNTQLRLDQEQTSYDRAQDDWEKRFKTQQAQWEQAFKESQEAFDRQRQAEKDAWERQQDTLEYQRKVDKDAWDKAQDQASLAIRRQQAGASQSKQTLEVLRKTANDLAQFGDFQGYKALGYDEYQIGVMRLLWQKYKGLN